MESLGEYIKSQREARNITLEEVARVTKIGKNILKAIESDRYDLLPAKVFTQGFLKIYASYLGVDEGEVVRRYQETLESLEIKGESKEGEGQRQPKRIITLTRVVLISAIVIVAVALWVFMKSQTGKKFFIEEEVPQKPTIETITPPSAVSTILPEEKAKEEVGAGEKVVGFPADSKEGESGGEVGEARVKEMVLRIVSSEITWIKLRRDDQEPYEVLLKPGESMELNAKKKFHLRIGNAGGVELFLDGKPLGKLGKQREVVELSLPE